MSSFNSRNHNRFILPSLSQEEIASLNGTPCNNGIRCDNGIHCDKTEFKLTEGVYPDNNVNIFLQEGYRWDSYNDPAENIKIPVVTCAASAEKLFDLFYSLVSAAQQENIFGNLLYVTLETSHKKTSRQNLGHTSIFIEGISTTVLLSTLVEYQDLLVNDGMTGIAIYNMLPQQATEIKLMEDKLIFIYGEDLGWALPVLDQHEIYFKPKMKLITDAKHVHSSTDEYYRTFEKLRMILGGSAIED